MRAHQSLPLRQSPQQRRHDGPPVARGDRSPTDSTQPCPTPQPRALAPSCSPDRRNQAGLCPLHREQEEDQHTGQAGRRGSKTTSTSDSPVAPLMQATNTRHHRCVRPPGTRSPTRNQVSPARIEGFLCLPGLFRAIRPNPHARPGRRIPVELGRPSTTRTACPDATRTGCWLSFDQRRTDSGRIRRCCPRRIHSAGSIVAAGNWRARPRASPRTSSTSLGMDPTPS